MAVPGADLLCIAVGLLIHACAVRDVRLVRRLRREGLRTEGLVVANIVNRRDESTTQTPVIRFHDHHGYLVEFTTAIQGLGMGLRPAGEWTWCTSRAARTRPGCTCGARWWARRWA